MKPDNDVDKYAVLIINKDRVVGHLMKGKNRKFAKLKFFFLGVDITNGHYQTVHSSPLTPAHSLPAKKILTHPQPPKIMPYTPQSLPSIQNNAPPTPTYPK